MACPAVFARARRSRTMVNMGFHPIPHYFMAGRRGAGVFAFLALGAEVQGRGADMGQSPIPHYWEGESAKRRPCPAHTFCASMCWLAIRLPASRAALADSAFPSFRCGRSRAGLTHGAKPHTPLLGMGKCESERRKSSSCMGDCRKRTENFKRTGLRERI